MKWRDAPEQASSSRWAVSSCTHEEAEKAAQTDHSKPIATEEPVPQKPQAQGNSECEGSLKLKNLLQNIPYIKPWIPQMRFELQGDCLHLIASPFVNSLLQSSDAKETILQSAQKIDPAILDLVFDQTNQAPSKITNDFEGL